MDQLIYFLLIMVVIYYFVNGVKGLGGGRKIPNPPPHLLKRKNEKISNQEIEDNFDFPNFPSCEPSPPKFPKDRIESNF